ncbi:MAG TPA: hypothetical protein VHE35_12490, partial [Kofleriaceae bacterium]|nr:hypothetical protein [Kofleriaceae bacterium]
EVRAGLPRGVERVMMKMLAKAPADRPASAQEVLAALEPFVTAGDGAAAGAAATGAARTGAGAAAAAGLGLSSTAAMPVAPILTPSGSRPDMKAAAPRLDTIALVDRASGPRQVSTGRAIAIVAALCVATAAVTYGVRSRWHAAAKPAAAVAPAVAAPAVGAATGAATEGPTAPGEAPGGGASR